MKKITQEDVDKAWVAWEKALEDWDKACKAWDKDWGKVRKALDKAGKGAWDEALEKAWELKRKFKEQEGLK